MTGYLPDVNAGASRARSGDEAITRELRADALNVRRARFAEPGSVSVARRRASKRGDRQERIAPRSWLATRRTGERARCAGRRFGEHRCERRSTTNADGQDRSDEAVATRRVAFTNRALHASKGALRGHEQDPSVASRFVALPSSSRPASTTLSASASALCPRGRTDLHRLLGLRASASAAKHFART